MTAAIGSTENHFSFHKQFSGRFVSAKLSLFHRRKGNSGGWKAPCVIVCSIPGSSSPPASSQRAASYALSRCEVFVPFVIVIGIVKSILIMIFEEVSFSQRRPSMIFITARYQYKKHVVKLQSYVYIYLERNFLGGQDTESRPELWAYSI